MAKFASPPDRRALLAAGAALLLAGCAQAAPPGRFVLYKTPICACCTAWLTQMEKAGFKATVMEMDDLYPIQARYGITPQLASCHTGVIDGFVFEGHVPPTDVARFLKERPKGLGLTVPGMPLGSPGMEMPGGQRDPFDTLLVLDRTGKTAFFARHRT
jgi:hypothetical protein